MLTNKAVINFQIGNGFVTHHVLKIIVIYSNFGHISRSLFKQKQYSAAYMQKFYIFK